MVPPLARGLVPRRPLTPSSNVTGSVASTPQRRPNALSSASSVMSVTPDGRGGGQPSPGVRVRRGSPRWPSTRVSVTGRPQATALTCQVRGTSSAPNR
jgi:hypothetical protein